MEQAHCSEIRITPPRCGIRLRLGIWLRQSWSQTICSKELVDGQWCAIGSYGAKNPRAGKYRGSTPGLFRSPNADDSRGK